MGHCTLFPFTFCRWIPFSSLFSQFRNGSSFVLLLASMFPKIPSVYTESKKKAETRPPRSRYLLLGGSLMKSKSWHQFCITSYRPVAVVINLVANLGLCSVCLHYTCPGRWKCMQTHLGGRYFCRARFSRDDATIPWHGSKNGTLSVDAVRVLSIFGVISLHSVKVLWCSAQHCCLMDWSGAFCWYGSF